MHESAPVHNSLQLHQDNTGLHRHENAHICMHDPMIWPTSQPMHDQHVGSRLPHRHGKKSSMACKLPAEVTHAAHRSAHLPASGSFFRLSAFLTHLIQHHILSGQWSGLAKVQACQWLSMVN